MSGTAAPHAGAPAALAIVGVARNCAGSIEATLARLQAAVPPGVALHWCIVESDSSDDIRGSEIQQRYTELMMLAAGPFAVPFVREAMEAGWQGDQALGGQWPGGAAHCAPLAATYFNHRKTTIYGGSNEVQRNIVAQTVLGS